MCARLSRCHRALEDRRARKRLGIKVPFLHTEDAIDADAFLEQHWSLCAMRPPSGTSEFPNPDLTEEPLDAEELQLIHALVDAEKFMRKSVNYYLPVLRTIEADVRCITSIPAPALSWVLKAEDLANAFRHCVNPETDYYRRIALQELRLLPALDKFLQLMSAVKSSSRCRNKQAPDLWTWPQLEFFDQNGEMPLCCPYTDIVGEIEEVQRLLNLQDESRDRVNRSNYSKARKVLNKAFVDSSKVLVIRLDLSFRKGIFQKAPALAHEPITAETQPDIWWAKVRFSKFLLHLTKAFGPDRLGYIWKLEYGIKKGFHYHLIILLNGGHKHQQDADIAKQLGEHWANVITAGQGT